MLDVTIARQVDSVAARLSPESTKVDFNLIY